MNITPLLNQQNHRINTVTKTPRQIHPAISKNQVSFGSAKSDGIIKLLDKSIDTLLSGGEMDIKNKLTFRRVLNEAIPHIMTPENFINKGQDSKVYRISDKYVAKFRRGYYGDNVCHFFDPIKLPSKHFMNLDFYYGEPVVKVGKLEILKNATPTENFVCCGSNFHYDGLSSHSELDAYENVYLPICSSLPQESFDKLAMNLNKLNHKRCSGGLFQKESPMLYDLNPELVRPDTFINRLHKKSFIPDVINPNNLIISDGEFRLVDSLEKVNQENPNSVYTMLEPLLIRVTPNTHATADKSLLPMRKQIYKKILISAEKCMLPLDSPIKYNYSDWVLKEILYGQNILDNLRRMRTSKTPISERVNLIEDFAKS